MVGESISLYVAKTPIIAAKEINERDRDQVPSPHSFRCPQISSARTRR